jgi:hypothetical protein
VSRGTNSDACLSHPRCRSPLGAPAADLTTLGSAALLKPDKNPGS